MTSIELPIIEVNHGLANNFGTHIEINKHLRNYPELLNPILEHEFSHTDKAVTWQDFKLDFIMPQAIHYKQLFNFMIKHPRSFTQFAPIYWTRKKGFIYDFNLIVMYLIMFTIITSTIYFGVKYF